MKLHAWTDLVGDGSIKALKYSFGVATANTLAARLDDGSWMVVSPAMKLPDPLYDALASDGGVSALVAPNAYHHMGQAAWRARFPKAVSYAPEGTLKRLASASKGVAYEPLASLTKILPARVRCVVPEGMKVPDLLVFAGSERGNVLFGGDLISNTVSEEMKPVPRFIFGLLGGGPGYRFNSVPGLVYLRDKAAWKRDVLARVEATPPAVVLPAHGNPVRDDVMAQTRAILSA